jgi:hypothetical protein
METSQECLDSKLVNIFLTIPRGLRGAEEVDEAEDYKAPGSNPGKEL